jgi:hypothetical protein
MTEEYDAIAEVEFADYKSGEEIAELQRELDLAQHRHKTDVEKLHQQNATLTRELTEASALISSQGIRLMDADDVAAELAEAWRLLALKLPAGVTVNGASIGKGCTLRTVASAIEGPKNAGAAPEPILKRQDMDGRQPWEKKP